MRRFTAVTLFLLLAFLALAVIALSSSAAAEEWKDNENSGSARWIEPPHSMGPVHIWKRSDDVNIDWFRFNASEGQLIEIKFRKYTRNPTIPDLSGYTYYIKWDLWGPYVPGRNVYRYTSTYPGQGEPREYHRRDTFAMLVPENLGGIYFIRVFVDPPNNDPYRDHAYYWMNVTVEDTRSLDTQKSYSGVQGQFQNYTVDFDIEDWYTINLDASANSGDLVTVTLTRGAAEHWIWIEAWSEIPFGLGQNDHMLNRSRAGDATTLRFEFTAPHPGLYYIRVFRWFYSHGETSYNLGVFVTSRALDGDDVASRGNPIPKSMKVTGQRLEMGYDTHDWYAVDIFDGDKRFKVTLDLVDPDVDDGYGCEMVVYNMAGQVMWSINNRYYYNDAYHWRSQMVLPPESTTTIFDQDETYYVRVSVDPAISDLNGFSTRYDLTFELANRAPTLETPFEDLYQWDEDGSISIELDSHFADVDGDSMEYVVFNKTAGFTIDNDGLDNGYLNITSPVNWNGEVWWRLRAVDRGQGESHFIIVDLRLRVNPVADRPMANESLTATCPEEGSATVDLNDLFFDVDEGPGGILTFGWYDYGLPEVTVTVNDITGEMTMVPGPDVFGTFTFDVWCFDDVVEHVPGEVGLTVTPVNDVPRITQSIPTLELDEGDTDDRVIDLAEYFIDVDGDDLLYTFLVPTTVKDYVSVIHRNNVRTESVIIIKVLDGYFYATFDINITCTDPDDTMVQQDVPVRIAPVPNAPEILYTPVGNPSDIDETQTQTFEVTDVMDHDLPEMGLHTYTWYLDDNVLANNGTTYVYRADYDSEGGHTVRVVVTDPFGLTAEAEWSFDVTNVNREPTASITTVPTALTEDERIILTVDASDPDGDPLTITWYRIGSEEDKVLGTGKRVETTLSPGTAQIEVEVRDDKGGEAVDTFTLKVSAVEEESALGTWMGIIVVIAIIVILALAFVKLRMASAAAQPAVKMDIDSLNAEYDPSGGSTPDHGDEYNPMPDYGDEYNKLD